MRLFVALLFVCLAAGCATPGPADLAETVTISVVGTNDVHGELMPHEGRGGLVTFSGYVDALRLLREADGAVLLVDAGDMWQGTLESNLNEGEVTVDAYNALGYVAAAIGNHEFDFGPAGPKPIPQSDADDPQGALKLRARQADFPLLAANLIDTATNAPVGWDNVRSSVLLTVEGVRVGLVGVTTEHALQTTIAANTVGLRVAPLAPAITREARELRADCAQLVIVLAHAGSRCEEFDDPADLSSCHLDGEIMRVAAEIPAGLVDHIVAGHVHRGIAHVVNGIAVTSSYSSTRAFSRVDFVIDRASGEVRDRQIFTPQRIRTDAEYAGGPVVPLAAVVAIGERAAEDAARRKAEKLGVYLETPMTLRPGPESELGNLMTDAVLAMSGADVSIHNVRGGIRGELPAGELTFGSVYRMFPFDNRLAVVPMSGAELRRVIANQAHQVGRRAGFSGMRVFIECGDQGMVVTMLRPDGREILDEDIVEVAVNDFLLLGGDDILTPVIPEAGYAIPADTPLVRDLLLDWFKAHGGRLRDTMFLDAAAARWNLPAEIPATCTYSQL
jgi:5'-nucleotidase